MSQKIYTNLDIKGNATIGDISNATSDTDKFLVSDAGVVKYRTGSEMLSDLGVAPGVASNVQHQVKAGVAINKGQAVYVTSADGTNMIVGLASNASEATSSKTMGLLDNTVAINGFANVITEGLLSGLNTIGAAAGDPVWLGTGGNLIYGLANKPSAPAHLVFIGVVTRVNANNGEIFIKAQNGFELNEIHDVDLKTTSPSGNEILAFEGAPVNLWKNKTISSVLGYTPYNASNPAGYTTNTGTVTSVSGTGGYGGLTLSGSVTTSGSLTLGGTPTGTWPIAISGNAATATNADYANAAGTASTATNANYLSILGGSGGNLNTMPYGRYYNYGSGSYWTNGPSGMSYGSVYNFGGSSESVLSLQLAADINHNSTSSTRTMWFRTGNNLGFQNDWKEVLHSGNYSSFAVPTSRTITINGTSYDLSSDRSWTVTANAVETDTLATVTARGAITSTRVTLNGGWTVPDSTMNYVGNFSTNDYSTMTFMSRAWQTVQGANGLAYTFNTHTNGGSGGFGALQIYYGESGYVYSPSSFRSPIFYDSNNTGYYVDPASTSSLNVLSMANKIILGSFPNSTTNNGEAWIGRAADRSAGTMTVQLGGNLDRKFEVVDYGWTTVNFSVNGYGAAEASGSMRAPIFYDSNNTGYYTDPASTSNLNAVNTQGLLQVAGSTGNYNEGIRLVSGTGSWSNIQFGANMTGAGTQANQWIVGKRPEGDFVISLAGNQNGGSRFLIQQDGRVQSPVYYDGNDTNYYLDPNGTSRMVTINADRLATPYAQSPNDSHPGFGIRPFYSWNIGQAGNATAGFSNGISIGSNPGDQAYGFQIVQNMWDDQLYFRRYNSGWQGWRTALDSSNYTGYRDWGGNAIYAGILYDGNNTGYYVDPNSASNMSSVYADNWFRSYGNTGLYGQSYGVHFYPQTGSAWSITGSGGNIELQFRSNHNSTIRGYVYADTSNNIGFLTSGGGWRLRCDDSGNAIATGDVTAYSDRRVKENIYTIDNALDKVNNLRGVYYTRIDSEDKQRKVGVIAQETLEILPEVVGQDTDGMYNVAYGNITAVLIEAIKEQQKQIEELKELVNQLIKR